MKLAYFGDLTHTMQGIASKAFPIGIASVAAYARKHLENQMSLELFKFPEELNNALSSKLPDLLCMSNYSWNLQIAYTFASKAKQKNPNLIVVFGGPNFPDLEEERVAFFNKYPAIDFYIIGEGEVGFVDLFINLDSMGMVASRLKNKKIQVKNCAYLDHGDLIMGDNERIDNLDNIDCPYTTGLLDRFFLMPLVPIIETTRGCPFKCTFCSDGRDAANKIFRYSRERVDETLQYIAEHVQDCSQLTISDLNFGMYSFDAGTAKTLARLQEEKGYPRSIMASAGKNQPERIIDIVETVKGTGFIGAALQSTDPEVLEAIKRKNISNEKILNLAEYGKEQGTLTYTEIILGLPKDSKEKHFESLRVGVDMGLTSIRMYQLMLLAGTEMASPNSRDAFGMMVKWRVLPGCSGTYKIFGEDCPIGEFEEIVIGNNTMSFQDYLDCRLMNLIIETFINGSLFEDVLAMLSALNLSRFDCLLYLLNHPELYSEKIKDQFKSYLKDTQEGLFGTEQEVREFIQTPENIEDYVAGKCGRNELLYNKAIFYLSLKETHQLMYAAVRGFLKEKGQLTHKLDDYLCELERFSLLRKQDFDKTDIEHIATFKYDFMAIERENFEIDPNVLKPSGPHTFKIRHDVEQEELILNYLIVYGTSVAGLGRLIQRCNLKQMFRKYAPIATPITINTQPALIA